MPYRVDLGDIGDSALDRLVDLGAIDAERAEDGHVAILMPDGITAAEVARAAGVDDVRISPAVARDDGSVWILTPRAILVGRLRIAPAHLPAQAGTLRLIDASAFGTGLHPTTALCLEAVEDILQTAAPQSMLDVGTGSGVLALAALTMGAARSLAIDVDDDALRVAAENARLNGLEHRLQLLRGGPASATGAWPLVVANVLAAPLIEMAPTLVRRVAHQGHLVLSGIPSSLQQDVERAYVRLGMRRLRVDARTGWVALVLRATW